MPIELTCTGCGRQLRVPDAHAGKQARCPACGQICPIPQSSPGNDNLPPPSPSPVGPSVTPPGPSPNPFADQASPQSQSPFSSPNPYQPPGYAGGVFQGAPHRGGLILTFGLLGFFCCIFFGIAAWIMGNEDLNAMRAGRMDPSGEGLTRAGMILGIICCAMQGLSIVFIALANMF